MGRAAEFDLQDRDGILQFGHQCDPAKVPILVQQLFQLNSWLLDPVAANLPVSIPAGGPSRVFAPASTHRVPSKEPGTFSGRGA